MNISFLTKIESFFLNLKSCVETGNNEYSIQKSIKFEFEKYLVSYKMRLFLQNKSVM